MTRTETPILQIDAFTDAPFGGNPAAVCLLDAPRDASWMQSVASEMNLSETAFLVPRNHDADDGDSFDLRWFTPAIEVDICGHATLASAHALWDTGEVSPDAGAIRFHTRSGVLTAVRSGDTIELDFPRYDTEPAEFTRELQTAFPIEPRDVVKVAGDRMGVETLLLELASADEVRALKPALAPLRRPDAPGVIVTAKADRADESFDVVSRCFFPSAGIDEDPATGSAHCVIGPYWSARLDKNPIVGFQASQRGATIIAEVAGDRCKLRGRAVTVLRGALLA